MRVLRDGRQLLRRQAIVGVAALVLALLVLASAVDDAGAAVLEVKRKDVPSLRIPLFSYRADAGENNRLRVHWRPDSSELGTLVVVDSGAPITVTGQTPECRQSSPHKVACAGDLGSSTLQIALGDGNDVATAPDANVISGGTGDDRLKGDNELFGGEGNDTLSAGNSTLSAGGELLDGGAGNDLLVGDETHEQLIGGRGNDRLRAGGGDDWLAGGAGRDELSGGSGDDRVSYTATRARPVRVTLDGRRNDGARGELDGVGRDVEGVRLSDDFGASVAIGDSRANSFSISGKVGPTVYAGAGNDSVRGNGTVYAGEGDDDILAWAGRFFGGPGNDHLYRGKLTSNEGDAFEGPARLDGGTGNDEIDAVNSISDDEREEGSWIGPVRDRVTCGMGRDTARGDTLDVLAVDCEVRKTVRHLKTVTQLVP